MTDKPNGNGASWFQKWLPVGAAAVVVGGVVATYFIGQGATQNTIDGLKLSVSSLDRKVQKLESSNNSLLGQIVALHVYDCAQFGRIEGQFATTETILNKTQIEDSRKIALLWDKVYAQPYPDMFYAVQIEHQQPECR